MEEIKLGRFEYCMALKAWRTIRDIKEGEGSVSIDRVRTRRILKNVDKYY